MHNYKRAERYLQWKNNCLYIGSEADSRGNVGGYVVLYGGWNTQQAVDHFRIRIDSDNIYNSNATNDQKLELISRYKLYVMTYGENPFGISEFNKKLNRDMYAQEDTFEEGN